MVLRPDGVDCADYVEKISNMLFGEWPTNSPPEELATNAISERKGPSKN